MRIAFIVNEFPLLSETFVLNQITGLIDRGHSVDIFATEEKKEMTVPSGDIKVHQDVLEYNLLEKTYYPPKIPQNKMRRSFEALRYVAKFMTKHPLAILKSLNIFQYGTSAASFTLLYQIIPFLGKGPYDIVHCHFGPSGNFATLLKDLKVLNGKFITAFHGYDMSKYLRTNGNSVYNALFKRGICSFR